MKVTSLSPAPHVVDGPRGQAAEHGQLTFVVSNGTFSSTIAARDDVEAWAVFCDTYNLSGYRAEPKHARIDGRPIGWKPRSESVVG